MLLSELFDQILERPALYVGNVSVVRLNAFMEGYWYAKSQAGEDVRDDLYGGFTPWVAARFGIASMHDWGGAVRFMAHERTGRLRDDQRVMGAVQGRVPGEFG